MALCLILGQPLISVVCEKAFGKAFLWNIVGEVSIGLAYFPIHSVDYRCNGWGFISLFRTTRKRQKEAQQHPKWVTELLS